VTALLAVGSAILIGCSDFIGGVVSRRGSAVRVAALAQFISFVLAVPTAVAVGATHVTGADAAWSLVSGVTVAVGLGLFYAAMKKGLISLVAPMAAITSATVPVIYALARGERPGTVALTGIVLALCAIAVVSLAPAGAEARDGANTSTVIGLSLIAGVFFGAFFICFSRTSEDAGLWPVVLSRAASGGILVGFALITLGGLAVGSLIRFVTPMGIAETIAGVALLLALQRGPVAIASVLASLYPVTTVLLAAGVLRERLSGVQLTGVVLALAAVVLVSIP
jgi:drug/metabolite transporter (DMT)-like permease